MIDRLRVGRYAIGPLLAVLALGSLLCLVTPASGDVLPANPLAIPGAPAALNSVASGLASLALVASVLLAIVAVVVERERTAPASGERLRSEVDLTGLEADSAVTIAMALRPSSLRIWNPAAVTGGSQ